MSTTTHPSWCSRNECIPPGEVPGDPTHHCTGLVPLAGRFQTEISQLDNGVPMLALLGEDDMTLPQLDEFIKALTAARDRLAQVH